MGGRLPPCLAQTRRRPLRRSSLEVKPVARVPIVANHHRGLAASVHMRALGTSNPSRTLRRSSGRGGPPLRPAVCVCRGADPSSCSEAQGHALQLLHGKETDTTCGCIPAAQPDHRAAARMSLISRSWATSGHAPPSKVTAVGGLCRKRAVAGQWRRRGELEGDCCKPQGNLPLPPQRMDSGDDFH